MSNLSEAVRHLEMAFDSLKKCDRDQYFKSVGYPTLASVRTNVSIAKGLIQSELIKVEGK